MHLPYCYHREGPHTLYYNDRHAFLFLSLSLNMIKMHSKFSSLTPPMIFWISKKPEYVWKPYSSKSFKQNFIKIGRKQRSYSNFNKRVKIAKFSEIFASRTPTFRLFYFYSDSESSRWEKSNGICPIEIGRLVLEIWRRGRIPSPPVNVLKKAHQ